MASATTAEVQVLSHFTGYERVRTTIEALSFEKHFERFAFAMIDIKARLRDLTLGQLIWDRWADVVWLTALPVVMGAWLRRTFRTRPTIQNGGQA